MVGQKEAQPMWTLRDARDRFSAVVEAALAGQPQKVSRRGRPAVVVLSAGDYRRLLADADARRAGFVEHILRFAGEGDGMRHEALDTAARLKAGLRTDPFTPDELTALRDEGRR
jgi:prevent-host-death family protein